MRKADFDHVIAAAAAVSGEDEIVVIGSQALLGTVPDPPAAMLRSLEADVYPRAAPAKAEEIDGALGDGSQFQSTFGYYAHGVGPETAKAPAGWEERLVRVEVPRRPGNDGSVIALCLGSTIWFSPSAPAAGNGTGTSRWTRSRRGSSTSRTPPRLSRGTAARPSGSGASEGDARRDRLTARTAGRLLS